MNPTLRSTTQSGQTRLKAEGSDDDNDILYYDRGIQCNKILITTKPNADIRQKPSFILYCTSSYWKAQHLQNMSLVYTAETRNRLYIGSRSDAKNRDKLQQWNVSHILNVTPAKDAGVQVCSHVLAFFMMDITVENGGLMLLFFHFEGPFPMPSFPFIHSFIH